MTTITLTYPPSSNRYWRVFQGRMVRSPEANVYKAAVGWLCKEANLVELEGELSVRLTFYRPARRGDLDNRLKIVLDALQGHAYANDDQIVEIHAKRREDKANPRVEIEIVEVVSE